MITRYAAPTIERLAESAGPRSKSGVNSRLTTTMPTMEKMGKAMSSLSSMSTPQLIFIKLNVWPIVLNIGRLRSRFFLAPYHSRARQGSEKPIA